MGFLGSTYWYAAPAVVVDANPDTSTISYTPNHLAMAAKIQYRGVEYITPTDVPASGVCYWSSVNQVNGETDPTSNFLYCYDAVKAASPGGMPGLVNGKWYTWQGVANAYAVDTGTHVETGVAIATQRLATVVYGGVTYTYSLTKYGCYKYINGGSTLYYCFHAGAAAGNSLTTVSKWYTSYLDDATGVAGVTAPAYATEFIAAGTLAWIAPMDGTVISTAIAAGASGGRGGLANAAGGGGGGGGYRRVTAIAVTKGTIYPVVIGAGGVARSAAGDGADGGDSSFNGATCTAVGGKAGKSPTNGGAGGAAGTGDFSGGSGGARNTGSGGGGGSSAGSAGNGNNGAAAASATAGGAGGAAPTGGYKGGNGNSNAAPDVTATAGDNYGGGGGGSNTEWNSGAGGGGYVKVEYTP